MLPYRIKQSYLDDAYVITGICAHFLGSVFNLAARNTDQDLMKEDILWQMSVSYCQHASQWANICLRDAPNGTKLHFYEEPR